MTDKPKHPLGPSTSAYSGIWVPTTQTRGDKRLWRCLGNGDVRWFHRDSPPDLTGPGPAAMVRECDTSSSS